MTFILSTMTAYCWRTMLSERSELNRKLYLFESCLLLCFVPSFRLVTEFLWELFGPSSLAGRCLTRFDIVWYYCMYTTLSRELLSTDSLEAMDFLAELPNPISEACTFNFVANRRRSLAFW